MDRGWTTKGGLIRGHRAALSIHPHLSSCPRLSFVLSLFPLCSFSFGTLGFHDPLLPSSPRFLRSLLRLANVSEAGHTYTYTYVGTSVRGTRLLGSCYTAGPPTSLQPPEENDNDSADATIAFLSTTTVGTFPSAAPLSEILASILLTTWD